MSSDQVTAGIGFGVLLRQYRLARGMTQEELAEASGLTPRTVANIERGRTRPYRRSARTLTDALGVSPTEREELDRAYRLNVDSSLVPTEQPSPGAGRVVVPRLVPAPVTHFVGRAAEMAALTRLLDQHDADTPDTMVVSVIGGTAGVGKTELAVQWAHQCAGRFPDGQLYVNLRGYDPAQPVAAADALAGFLYALDVPGKEIPSGEDERAARYRSLLDGRRMLVLLDNAGSAEQVRPLLPGSPACTVVVTSRDTLAGMVARHGAVRLEVDLLPVADAVTLLQDLIGEQARADPGAVVALADRCARLPLALRVAAELAAARPSDPLADLVNELADQQQWLDLLEAGGDPRTAVREVFSWSFWRLDADAARAFRLTALHPGLDFDGYAVAALAGISLEQGRRILNVLARAHLVQAAGPGRYSLHDLLRSYARELAAAQDREAEQQAALTRLFDHYLSTAASAMDALYPAEQHRRPRIPPPASPAPPVTSLDGARGWLDAERPTLVAVTGYAAGHGWPAHAIRLSATMFRYLDRGAHVPEAINIHSFARIAAQRTGDIAAEAAALNALGVATVQQGSGQQAADYLEQALAIFRQTGDRTGQARALSNLGMACYLEGRYRRASEWCQQALAFHRASGDQVGETLLLANLGLLDLRQGRYREASERLWQALALARATGNRAMETGVLIRLGEVSVQERAYKRATRLLLQALVLARATGARYDEVMALARLGEAYLRLDHHEEASSHLSQALALFREIGDQSDEADALNGLGEILLAIGQPIQACAHHTAALGLAAQVGAKLQQARAHHGLARAHQAAADPGQARPHWQQALALYTDLSVPEADQVRAELVTADHDGQPEP